MILLGASMLDMSLLKKTYCMSQCARQSNCILLHMVLRAYWKSVVGLGSQLRYFSRMSFVQSLRIPRRLLLSTGGNGRFQGEM